MGHLINNVSLCHQELHYLHMLHIHIDIDIELLDVLKLVSFHVGLETLPEEFMMF